MTRKAFVIHAKEGKIEEYIRNHNPVWPELKEVLKAHEGTIRVLHELKPVGVLMAGD